MSEPASPSLEPVRRVAESVVIAAISSVALYLVGFVYVDAYYGRLSLEILSPDLPSPYVALQSIHALWGLLNYPLTLLIAIVMYHVLADPAHRPGQWLETARKRFPRLLPALTNVLVVAPLILKAGASWQSRELPHRSVLAEITSVLGVVGVVLLAYGLWLGWSQRRYLLPEIKARRAVPITLVFAAYLLSALVFTGEAAELAAVDLVTGASPASTRVTFVTSPGAFPELADMVLVLVAERSGTYYVVEWEASPSSWTTSYAIPTGDIEAVRMRPFQAP